jgi:hypothetical protein
MFGEGFKKTAGVKTELVGAAGGPIPAAIGAAIGHSHGPYSKKEQEEADKKTWSNVLIPGMGGYRAWRRHLGHKKEKHEKEK